MANSAKCHDMSRRAFLGGTAAFAGAPQMQKQKLQGAKPKDKKGVKP